MFKREYLVEEYVEKEKTTREIAAVNNTTRHTVSYWLKKFDIPVRKGGRKRPELKNKVFGNLQVIGDDPDHKIKWLCKCDCGNKCSLFTSSLLRGQKGCWECRGDRISEKKWKGHEEISGEFWSKIQSSAARRSLEFDISIEYIWDLFVDQEKRCALTETPLVFARRKVNRSKITASLDRIDSTKGYVEGNVQWVHKTINYIKMDLDQNEFVEWCSKVVECTRPSIP